MKSKMLIAILLGCLVWQQGVLSQTDTVATDTNQGIGAIATNPPTAPAASTTESSSVTSSVAAPTVVFPPSITTQPASQTVANGNNTTFSVTAEGTPPLSYQWYFNGSVISGATAANYSIISVTASNEGNYAVVITNSYGSVTSSNATVGTITANPPMAPAVAANESPSATTSNETAGATATNPPAAPSISANESPSAATSNATAAASAANPPVAAAAGTNESSSATTGNPQAPAPASIPLIQFQDVPITTAIENLARQAGINYLLDPKIGYGQPDANGQVKPEPTLSIRWENITAEQALLALLDNYNLQLVEDRRTRIARITTKDPMAPPPLTTRVIQLKYASTSNMVDSIHASLTDKRSKVLPDVRTSQLIVVATDPEQEAVDTLINQLDKPTRQVLIETKLVEISSNPTTAKGVDWSGTLAAQHVTFGNGFQSGSTAVQLHPGASSASGGTPGGGYGGGTPSSSQSTTLNVSGEGTGGFSWNTVSGLTPEIGFLSADGASAVIHFLNAAYDAQVVSTPRIVTLDNQMATIEVTRGYPIINMTGGTQNSAGSSSVTYSNVGTILEVTPRISANDFIWLKVVPVVSSHFGDVIVTVVGGGNNQSSSYAVPEFDYRRIDSQVMIPNGNTLVMGGLVQDNPTASYAKVPVLGDIPGLGWAFRSETKATTKDNLIIFLTPTIIQSTDFQPATSIPADFLQSKPSVMKNRMNPNSVWDGAEPGGDWSNPAPVASDDFNK
jgi:type II secretory pathway component GspD/PulD (secretin)